MGGTYDLMSFDALPVQVVQLRLALVEVVQVCAFQSNPRMSLIDLIKL
jgi:hypothetical protein